MASEPKLRFKSCQAVFRVSILVGFGASKTDGCLRWRATKFDIEIGENIFRRKLKVEMCLKASRKFRCACWWPSTTLLSVSTIEHNITIWVFSRAHNSRLVGVHLRWSEFCFRKLMFGCDKYSSLKFLLLLCGVKCFLWSVVCYSGSAHFSQFKYTH